jgi:hypothetical protein
MDNSILNNKVWLDSKNIYVQMQNGEVKNHPLNLFPKLLNASELERAEFEISPFGIHWPKLDEDLSFEGFYSYKPNSH